MARDLIATILNAWIETVQVILTEVNDESNRSECCYNACMDEISMTIRHIPVEWRAELAARAARQSQSLQEFMLKEIEAIVDHPPLDVVIERARRRAEAADVELDIDDLLADRDADRR